MYIVAVSMADLDIVQHGASITYIHYTRNAAVKGVMQVAAGSQHLANVGLMFQYRKKASLRASLSVES